MLPSAVKIVENNLVCNNLVEKYNLDLQEQKNILLHLQKLEQNVSPEQVAYEITEEYNLLSVNDYNYVLKTIKSRDKILMDFLSNNS